MTHHQKHDIKQDIKTKESEHQNQTGRSMVEMLGVLAVAGVLSVGGIMAYQSAMNKHRANTIMDGVSKRATILTAQALEGTGYNLGEFDDTIDGTYGVELVEKTGYENEFGLKVTGISEKVCSKIMDMDWSQPREITGDTGCDADENALTFAFAANGDNTTARTATPKECSGTRPSCQKCDTGTGNYVTDSSKDNTQDTCSSGYLCNSGICVVTTETTTTTTEYATTTGGGCTGEQPSCQMCDMSTGNWVADSSKDNTQDTCADGYVCGSGICVATTEPVTTTTEVTTTTGVVIECTGDRPACQVCDTTTGNWVADRGKDGTQDTCNANYECNKGKCITECTGDRPACQVCDTTTGNWVVDSSKNNKQDTCYENYVCVSGFCKLTGCSSYADCSNGEYCKFNPNNCENSGKGTCNTLDEGILKGNYLVSSSTMDWWSAGDWCAAHNMTLFDATASPFNCSESSWSCPDWSAFTNLGLNAEYWTNDDTEGNESGCWAWYVDSVYKDYDYGVGASSRANSKYALCQ